MPNVSFVGFESFQNMFADRVFWTSLRNTIIYVGLLMPISVAIGLGVALLIKAGTRGRGF